jgi:hypothetical protein
MWEATITMRNNIACQIYLHKCGFSATYPVQKVDGNHVGDTLTQFISDYGAPEHLTFDGESVQTGPKTRFMDAIRRYKINYHVSGPQRSNENPTEQSIHEVKKRWYWIMLKKKVPARLWDYGFTWVCETENICANLSKNAEGGTPIEIITADTPDMSESLDFEIYDWVLHRSNAGLGEVKVGRWLGVSHRVGRLMSYWVLPESGIPVSVTTVQRLTNDERNTDEMKGRMSQYGEKLRVLFESQSADASQGLRDVDTSKVIDPDNEDPVFFEEFTRIIDDTTLPHADELGNVEVVTDNHVGMEFSLARGGECELVNATVRRRLNDEEGKPIGYAHANPLLDSRRYKIEYVDGHLIELTANVIAENLIAQVDVEGR